MPRTRLALAAAAAALCLATPAAAVDTRTAGLQSALRARGLYAGPVDGVIGPATVEAIVRFQRRVGIEVDGIAGPETRAALGRLGRPLFGKRLLLEGRIGWDVSVLQFLLRRAGFRPGRVDGRFGQATSQAVIGFQQAAELAADGIVGPATRASLLGRDERPDASAGIPALLDRYAGRYGVPRSLVRAVAWQESGFQPHVVSSAGARGVMQVTPIAWDFVEDVLLGRKVPRTVAGNIQVGVLTLGHLLRTFGDERLAVAAYYQGARSVRRHGLFAETRGYVENVLALKGRV